MKRDKAIDTVRELPQEFELEELMERLVFIERLKKDFSKQKKES